MTNTLKSSLLCPEGAALFERHPPHFSTAVYRQVKELGGMVRKGEKACPVVFWKQLEIEDKESGEKEKIPMLRFYHVFNVAQCEGMKNLPSPTENPVGTIAKPAEIIEKMPQRPIINHGMRKAFYVPASDSIGMPNMDCFENEAEYYSTLFHELIHSTGADSRLNRSTLKESSGYGSDPYCKEELIAEMGAAFLCGHADIAERTLDNSAAYLKGWLQHLKEDKTLIVQAAAQAQKAADFILGTKFSEVSPNQEG